MHVEHATATASQNFVDFWASLLERAKKDPAFEKKLRASPMDELAALGHKVSDPALRTMIEKGIQLALAAPGAVETLRGPRARREESLLDGYISATPNWWGLVFTLSPKCCTDLAAGLGIGAAVSGAVAAIPAAAPFAVPIALAFGLAGGTIALMDRGKGVYITLLWASLALPAIPIIPTPVT